MAPQRKTFPRLFLARHDPYRLEGERVFLRPPERGDFEAWAALREQSRNFLVPWEPTWPPDALARSAFRARVARYALQRVLGGVRAILGGAVDEIGLAAATVTPVLEGDPTLRPRFVPGVPQARVQR